MKESVSRRGFMVLGGVVLLGGCSATSSPSSRRRPTGPASSTSSTQFRLPTVTPWRPKPNDVTPAAKLAAVRHIEARGTTASAALQVIDAQYGGILIGKASVLVVCRSWQSTPQGLQESGTTYDVRVSRSGHGWKVTAVHPGHPGPPAARHSLAARRVLTSPRIDLPPAARRDVLSGHVHESVLIAMERLSLTYRIGVSVVRAGHPLYVFGTSRLSDHSQGRAFDTWRIDGRSVIDPRTPRGLVIGYMEAAAAAGSYNIGGPYPVGSPPQYFSDLTHRDHVHVAFAT